MQVVGPLPLVSDAVGSEAQRSGHSQVDAEAGTLTGPIRIGRDQRQLLAVTDDSPDRVALEQAAGRAGAVDDVGTVQRDGRHRLPDEMAHQCSAHLLDLGQFGHGQEPMYQWRQLPVTAVSVVWAGPIL